MGQADRFESPASHLCKLFRSFIQRICVCIKQIVKAGIANRCNDIGEQEISILSALSKISTFMDQKNRRADRPLNLKEVMNAILFIQCI